MGILDSLDMQFGSSLWICQGILQPNIASQLEDSLGFECYRCNTALLAKNSAKA